MELEARKAVISDFYEKVGGAPALSHLTGITANSLRVCKHRGVLSKINKFELMEVANEKGFELPSCIFEAVKPEGEKND